MKVDGTFITFGSIRQNLDDDNDEDNYERIILPGSVGIALINGNREYCISDIFYNPRQNSLCYRGRYIDQKETDTSIVILPISKVIEIPGESKIGRYNFDIGTFEETM